MKDLNKKCTVAIVQDSPVLFNKEACLKKALSSIYLTANNKVDLIVFPELFIPGYPYGMNFGFTVGSRQEYGRKDYKRYYDNSIVIPGRETALLAEAAKQVNSYVSIGVSERDPIGTTLYNTNIIFDNKGNIVNIHRKLKPTGSERVVYGDSNKFHLPVTDTPWGKMGSLICWESYMPLARVALYQKGITLYISPNTNDNKEWFSTIKHIAIEGHCYFINANMIIRKNLYPEDLLSQEEIQKLDEMPCTGGSCIVDPYGHFVNEPVFDEETIIYATIDMDKVVESRMEMDCCGHYSRNDVLDLKINEDEKADLEEIEKINQENIEIIKSGYKEEVTPFSEEDYTLESFDDDDEEMMERLRQMQEDEENARWNKSVREENDLQSQIYNPSPYENPQNIEDEREENQETENYFDEETARNLENIKNVEARLKENPINDLDLMVQNLIRWSQEHSEEEEEKNNDNDDSDYTTLEDIINKIL